MDEQKYLKAVNDLALAKQRLKRLMESHSPFPPHLVEDLQNAMSHVRLARAKVEELGKEATLEQRRRYSIPYPITTKIGARFSAN